MSLLPAIGPPPGGLTEHALWLTGIVEPVPYLLTMLVPAGADDDVEQQLTRVLPPVLGHGRYRRVAAALQQLPDGTARLALALQESFIELSPIARALPAGGRLILAGRALSPYGKPEVYVTAPDGKVSRLPLDGKGVAPGALRATFTCGARPGAYQIEVAAEDTLGDAVLANFPVHCGVASAGGDGRTARRRPACHRRARGGTRQAARRRGGARARAAAEEPGRRRAAAAERGHAPVRRGPRSLGGHARPPLLRPHLARHRLGDGSAGARRGGGGARAREPRTRLVGGGA